jgi:hypothetical protein
MPLSRDGGVIEQDVERGGLSGAGRCQTATTRALIVPLAIVCDPACDAG